MFSRKYEDKHGTLLPDEWIQASTLALNERFSAFTNAYQFLVYGEVQSDEILLVVSALNRDLDRSAITLFLSLDADEKKIKKSQSILDTMLITSELFFEEVFDTDSWSDYSSRWLETESQGEDFFYKVTRENIYLTIEANKLLNS